MRGFKNSCFGRVFKENIMRYWPTYENGKYVDEYGTLTDLSDVVRNDLNPEFIFDETIEMPDAVNKVMEELNYA